jgi:Ca2+:H+ antiporter
VALVSEAAFHHLGGADAIPREVPLTLAIAGVLITAYALGLVFSLHTHKHLFAGHGREAAEVEDAAAGRTWGLGKSFAVLLASTAAIAWMSEILVGSVEGAAATLGMSELFVGVVVVAIVGNAAEHSTAILMAWKNRNDLALSIAVGSSIQIALFVAPALVFLSYWIAPRPLDLIFTPAEVLAVVMAVVVTEQISGDGESNWLEGAMLLAVYAILGVVFYLLPAGAAH